MVVHVLTRHLGPLFIVHNEKGEIAVRDQDSITLEPHYLQKLIMK